MMPMMPRKNPAGHNAKQVLETSLLKRRVAARQARNMSAPNATRLPSPLLHFIPPAYSPIPRCVRGS